MSDNIPIFPNANRPALPYSPALRVGNLVFVSGQVPIDLETGAVVGEEISEQTRQTLRNLRATVEAAGVGLGRVVKTTVFLTDIADLAAMNTAYREAFDGVLPARSTVQVSALARPEFRVEIEAMATIP